MSLTKTSEIFKISQYVIQKKISSGSSATVYLATKDEKFYAIKKPYILTFSDPNNVRLSSENEISILKELRHPNVINLHDIVWENNSQVYLVLEYVPYDLASVIRDKKNLKLTKTEHKNWLLQIASALSYMHAKGIIHRDLKASNILCSNNVVKIADFGSSRHIAGQMTGNVTTLWYRSPELLLGKTNYGEEIDIWSLGCIAYELICGELLFIENTEIQMLDKIFSTFGFPSTVIAPNLCYLRQMNHHTYHFDDILRDKCCSEEQVQFLERFFVYEAEKRVTAKGVLQSEYLNIKPQ
ncbi:[RNA-polymerase]-subunit kinase, cyclin-dependent kinase [Trachipleistophora hominis]|uniref:[RNA-polymerase]-subunit kinase, cyclin-dependent kinase n=1 Tax=Trachipleistophora hominis TaxID=72359 RepID=L7JZ90_TRAHO|nr:[RNA-polymerase]-subunit kinase, cyclin-dependent kinase [Trachipleistophora hominis]